MLLIKVSYDSNYVEIKTLVSRHPAPDGTITTQRLEVKHPSKVLAVLEALLEMMDVEDVILTKIDEGQERTVAQW